MRCVTCSGNFDPWKRWGYDGTNARSVSVSYCGESCKPGGRQWLRFGGPDKPTPPPIEARRKTEPAAIAEGVDPLEWHYGSYDTEPLIPVSDWPIAVGDLVVDKDGNQGQVVVTRWATKHLSNGRAVWDSWVEVIPGRVGATSIGRGRHGSSRIYRANALTVVTRWADLDG